MAMETVNYHTSAAEFLALGVLAQAPGETMDRSKLYRFLKEKARFLSPNTIINALIKADLIAQDAHRHSVTLTELGARARREPGESSIPRFLTVPEVYFMRTPRKS